jgi:hypothetical protein
MADAHIVSKDQTGAGLKKVQTVSNTVGADTVHAQAYFIVDTEGKPINYRPRQVIVTPTMDTAALAVGDVACAQFLVNGIAPGNDLKCNITGLTILDKDDQSFGGKVFLLKSNVSMGTANAAISISDANAENIIGVIPFFQSEFDDLIGCKRWENMSLRKPVVPVSGTDDIYAQIVITEGTPTFTASGLIVSFWAD